MNFFFYLKICFKWHKLNVLIKAITNEQNINRTHSYNVYTIKHKILFESHFITLVENIKLYVTMCYDFIHCINI